MQEIIAGAHVGPQRSVDLDVQFDYTFWMGDLNYRLDCSRSTELRDKPWAEVSVFMCWFDNPCSLDRTDARHTKVVCGPIHPIQKQQRAAVLAMIEKGDWQGLYALDELRRELEEGNLLSGFATPAPEFAPTFKVRLFVGSLGSFFGGVEAWTLLSISVFFVFVLWW